MRALAGGRTLSKAVAAIVVAGAIGLLLAGAGVAAGQASLSAIDTAYTQDFNTLASTGQSDVVPLGWAFSELGTNANTTYTAGTGSNNAGDTYSFGSTGSSERAFGSLLSGSLIPMIGVAFTNNTGATISSLDVAYAGEQWRLGQSGRGADRLDFEYNLSATSLTQASGWVDVNSLDFSSPVTVGTVGALDGNASANRTALSGTITGLSIAPGQTFWLRWADFNVSGSDDGLAIDDFSLTPHAAHTISVADATVTEGDSGTTTASFAVSLSTPAPTGGVTFDIATSDDSAQAPDDYTAASATGATIPSGESTYTFNVFVNGDTTVEPDESFSVDISNVSGVDAGDTHAVGTILNDDLPPPVPIHDIQGATHISPLAGQRPRVLGIVTAKSTNGFWMQDPSPDADTATSEGIFVFTSSPPSAVAIGDSVRVQGTVQEFRPGGTTNGNLTTTELSGTPTVTVLSTGNPLPAADRGRHRRSHPAEHGDRGRRDRQRRDERRLSTRPGRHRLLREPRGHARPAERRGRRRADEPTSARSPVVGDDGANAAVRTPPRRPRCSRPDDFNPERVIARRLARPPLPNVNVGDHYSGPIVGVLDYNFGNFVPRGHLGAAQRDPRRRSTRETTDRRRGRRARDRDLQRREPRPADPPDKFAALAGLIVNNLRSPDLIAVEEIQDNNGATNNGIVDAIADAHAARRRDRGGGRPDLRVPPDRPGRTTRTAAQPGGNIRVGLPLPDRPRPRVRRPARRRLDDAESPSSSSGGADALQLQPRPHRPDRRGRGRQPQAAGRRVHLPRPQAVRDREPLQLEGRRRAAARPLPAAESRRPRRSGTSRRTMVADFVASILAADPNADVVVLGDLNDFEFSETVQILEAAGLTTT